MSEITDEEWSLHDRYSCSCGRCFVWRNTPSHIRESWPQSAWIEMLKNKPGEDGEVRVTSETGGQKGDKLARFDLLPAKPLWKVAELYGAGARKYADRNWEAGYPWHLSYAAMMRHAWSFWDGEDVDPETQCHHLASVVFHALALLEYGETHPEFDDRPKP